jgi:hypothetical protein
MRKWSVEEQTMIDLMALNGHHISPDINKEYTSIYLYNGTPVGRRFRADTAYEALRKTFNYWTKHNA